MNFEDFGCCELISEMARIVEELKTRGAEEFDSWDLDRLVGVARELLNLWFKLAPPRTKEAVETATY